MSVEETFLTLVVVFIWAAVIVAANYADRDRGTQTRQIVVGILLLFNGLLVALYGVMPIVTAYTGLESSDLEPPTRLAAWGAFAGALILAGLSTAVLLRPVRYRLIVLFPRFTPHAESVMLPELPELPTTGSNPDLTPKPAGTPLFPQMLNYYTAEALMVPRPATALGLFDSPPAVRPGTPGSNSVGGFNPDSTVHLVALVSCLYLLGVQLINFILGGGLSGVAESFSEDLSVWDLLLNGLPLVILPILGIGLGTRRGWSATLSRLGLAKPSLEGVGISLVVTVGLFIFVAIMSSIWMALVSEETYEEQTEASQALSDSVDTIVLAFALAVIAAISEEIAFRGALQPVFGFWPTAIVFALTHAQYTLTPASLIILGVAIAFGWIRRRYNTTIAILTHFLYNFIPLALAVMIEEEESMIWLLKLLG